MLYVKYGEKEMSFENVDDDDDGRMTDACLYYKLTSTQVS